MSFKVMGNAVSGKMRELSLHKQHKVLMCLPEQKKIAVFADQDAAMEAIDDAIAFGNDGRFGYSHLAKRNYRIVETDEKPNV